MAHRRDGRLLDRVTDAAARLRPHVAAGDLSRVSVVAALTAAAAAGAVAQDAATAAVLTGLDRGVE
ncbi:hypothetical protein ACI79V_08895 [Geodermatophilus sp. SYSU D00700]